MAGNYGYFRQNRMIAMGRVITILMIYACLLFSVIHLVWGEKKGGQDELIQRMIQIVLENNPSLKSQERLVQESQGLPEPRPTFAISGMSFNAGAVVWNPETKSFTFVPTVTMGLSLSLRDPGRVLNSFNLKKVKEGARQDCHKIKNSIVSDLLSRVREILRLESQRENLEDLKVYLEDYSNLTEKQVKAGLIEPDKLWDLKERILSLNVELQDVKNQLNTIMLEAAMGLAGDAWGELLELFEQLGAQI